MNLLVYVVVALTLLGLALRLLRLVAISPSLGGVCALLVAFGLVYDNTVIALGRSIGEGELLLALSWPRYVIHALATPTLILFAWDAARRAGLGWADRRIWATLAWLLTLTMIAYGVFVELIGTRLEFTLEEGVAHYSAAGEASFPLPAAVTSLVLLAAGAALWIGKGRWILAGASLLSIAGFGLAPAVGVPVLGQIAEVILMAGVVATYARTARGQARTLAVG